MAAVANSKTLSTFSRGIEVVNVTYDFAVDGGAASALDLATAGQDLVIHKVVSKVKTAVTSAGAATVEVGKSGDTAGLVAQTGKASLGIGVVVDSKIGGYKLASGGVIQQLIGTAALTAGKIVYEIHYSKF